MLYCFRQSDTGELSIQELINKIEAGDIVASELVVGTTLDIKELRGVKTNENGDDEKEIVADGPLQGANLVKGVKRAVQLCLKKISGEQRKDQD